MHDSGNRGHWLDVLLRVLYEFRSMMGLIWGKGVHLPTTRSASNRARQSSPG
jgi:hypothetical protein